MTTVTQSPAARPGTAAAARWLPLAVLMAGTFMFVLDFFVVNVALPAIQRGLGAGALEWVVAGYGLTTAVFLVTGGRLGDQYGRRWMFAAGLALFVLTSAACGLAPTAGALVAARLAQGLGAALMSPNVLSIIGVLYTGARRIRAISVYGMVMGLAAVGGQLIGGLLIGADLAGWGWRAVFWVNVPIGAAALAAVRLIPESRADRGNRLDLGGVTLITAALLAVLLPLIQGRQLGWPAWSWGCLAAGPVLLAGFGWYERALARRGGTPLLDLGEFRAIPATPALAVRGMVTVAGFGPWWMSVFGDLYAAVDRAGLAPAGPGGALYPAELFTEEQGEMTAFVPVASVPAAPPGPGGPAVLEIPAVEAAVMLHEGGMDDLDRTYGALGTIVAERAIGVEGPIREYYLVGFRDTEDQSRHRTEVCWPVFQTRGQG